MKPRQIYRGFRFLLRGSLLIATLGVFNAGLLLASEVEDEDVPAYEPPIAADEGSPAPSTPLITREAMPGNTAASDASESVSGEADRIPADHTAALTQNIEAEAKVVARENFILLGDSLTPGSMQTLRWSPQNIFEGMPLPTPVLVANGEKAGPVVCLTGAVHGDEINSIETIRRVMFGLDPRKLAGTVVGIPIVNQMGFRRGSRYLPDRRDLNRYFPGTPTGSSAARIAYSLFNEVIQHCDALVDLHTGSFHRTNIPQLRADLNKVSVRTLVEQFGNIVVLHSEGSPGMLRREAVQVGVPTVTLEAGESLRIQEDVIIAGAKHIRTLLANLNMIAKGFFFGDPQPVYMASRWLRAESGGIFMSAKKPGDTVVEGEFLGAITDPITNNKHDVHAEFAGKIIGMAMDQVVLPGYAIYHVGMDASLVAKNTGQPRQELLEIADSDNHSSNFSEEAFAKEAFNETGAATLMDAKDDHAVDSVSSSEAE